MVLPDSAGGKGERQHGQHQREARKHFKPHLAQTPFVTYAETLALARQRLSHLDRRDRVLGGDAAQVARVLGIIVGAAAVQGTAVVPDHEVADAPVMAMDELALRGVLHQVAQQQPSIRHRPTEDVGGVRAHVERLALGARMRAHELVAHGRQGGALGFRVVGVAEQSARMEDRVLGDQAIDPGLRLSRQGVVGGPKIRELRLPAGRRHHVREQHRERARHLAERGIGVPELVGERIEPTVIVARAQLVAGVEIGDVGKCRVLQALHDAVIARRLDVAEQLAQPQERIVVELLVVEHQHGVAVDGVVELAHRLGRKLGGEIDARHLAHELGMQLPHLNHESPPILLSGAPCRSLNDCATGRHRPCR